VNFGYAGLMKDKQGQLPHLPPDKAAALTTVERQPLGSATA